MKKQSLGKQLLNVVDLLLSFQNRASQTEAFDLCIEEVV